MMSLFKFIKRAYVTWTLAEIRHGLAITFKTMLKPKTTLHFPEVQTPVSPRFRGMLALRRYPNGEERCIACKLCEAVCPANAITIDAKMTENGVRRTTKFEIDAFKCIYCGLCEQACPVDSIVLTNVHQYHMEHRGENIFTKEKLLAIGDRYESVIAKDREEDKEYR